MALPASGAISFSDINVELGLSATAQLSLGSPNVRTLFGIASGAIAMGAGYGKANQFAFNLTAGANVDLRTQAIAAGWNQSSKVVATLASGTISSSSTGSYALTISGSFPGGLDFINNGTITGRGGNGGQGGNANPGNQGLGATASSTNGGAAGPALFVSTAVSITNTSGSINGGGGGGGGGNAGNYISKSSGWYEGGGGGGGGGIGGSSGGGAGSNFSGGTPANAGSAGTLTTTGTGGSRGTSAGGGQGGTGGNGGGYGSAGASASGGAGTARTGGAAGAAIVGNSNITWVAFGTRNGSIS